MAFPIHRMGFHVGNKLLWAERCPAGAFGIAAGMDAAELMDARLAVREEQKCAAIDRVKAAYGEKYDPMMMHDSKRDVANLLHEEAEVRSVREFMRRKQKQAGTAKTE